jgi:hypothetical protein
VGHADLGIIDLGIGRPGTGLLGICSFYWGNLREFKDFPCSGQDKMIRAYRIRLKWRGAARGAD